MQNTVAYQLFQSLSANEVLRFEKFLNSPYFNQRQDVRDLLGNFRHAAELPDKKALFAQLYPDQAFNNLQLNYVLGFFAERLEQFLACEELQSDHFQQQLLRCRAFRKRGLSRHFERNAQTLARARGQAPLRNAEYWLQTYQLESEVFAQQMPGSRIAPDNLPRLIYAFNQFVALESLRWASTAHALSAVSKGAAQELPFTDTAISYAESSQEPATMLLRESLEVLRNPAAETAFQRLKTLISTHAPLFSPTEARDILMAAINFCIRRHNQGDKHYTREALELYKKGLDTGILLEQEQLSRYTYGNINNLAHLVGETAWAKKFLDTYRPCLPAAEREKVYQYNIAIHHFRCSEYAQALELLRDIEFSEVFVNLDVRKMLVRSYFELGEWPALFSLLDSFRAYLRRQKQLGYHRESYLNFLKFTLRVEKTMRTGKAKRQALARRIAATPSVAEREWLLGKL